MGSKRAEDAESVLRDLLRRLPGHRSTAINLANSLELANKVDQAAELLSRIFRWRSLMCSDASWPQGCCAGRVNTSRQRHACGELRESGEASTAQFRSSVEFEYGKCMDACGDYHSAVRAFEDGNRLIRDFIARENGVDYNRAMPWEQRSSRSSTSMYRACGRPRAQRWRPGAGEPDFQWGSRAPVLP